MAVLVDGHHPEAVHGERDEAGDLVRRLAALGEDRLHLVPVAVFADSGKGKVRFCLFIYF